MTAASLFAQQVDPDEVSAGWLGFIVIAGMFLLTVLLWRSMNKQLKKVNFERPALDDTTDGDEAEHDEPTRPPTG